MKVERPNLNLMDSNLGNHLSNLNYPTWFGPINHSLELKYLWMAGLKYLQTAAFALLTYELVITYRSSIQAFQALILIQRAVTEFHNFERFQFGHVPFSNIIQKKQLSNFVKHQIKVNNTAQTFETFKTLKCCYFILNEPLCVVP